MAQIILGIGTSHSPMLSTPYEGFGGHAERDRANRHVPVRKQARASEWHLRCGARGKPGEGGTRCSLAKTMS